VAETSDAIDSEVLRLRNNGRSYGRISRELGMERAIHAQHAFRRAVGRLSTVDRDRARSEEATRLDELEAKVNSDGSSSADDRTRRLAAIARLRIWTTDAP
jgi:hypothetical protein